MQNVHLRAIKATKHGFELNLLDKRQNPSEAYQAGPHAEDPEKPEFDKILVAMDEIDLA